MRILQPGDPAGQQCPDCGQQMTMQRAARPSNGVDCGMAHWKSACLPCEQRRWETRERPATIGELNELGAKVERLLAAMGLGDD